MLQTFRTTLACFGLLTNTQAFAEATTEVEPVEGDLRGAQMKGANLQRAYLFGANLQLADLRGAQLDRAHLSHADLRGADLRGATLGTAYLHKTDLRAADLRG